MKRKLIRNIIILLIGIFIFILILNSQKQEKVLDETIEKGSFIILPNEQPYAEKYKYLYNNKTYTNENPIIVQHEGPLMPTYFFEIPKKNGEYKFENFHSITNEEVVVSFTNQPDDCKITINNTENKSIYFVEFFGNFDYSEGIRFSNKIGNIKYLEIEIKEKSSFYINIEKDSIELYSDNNTNVLIDLYANNDKKGNSKRYELTLTKNPITITVDEDNNYSKKENGIQEIAKKKYRVEFLDLGIVYELDEGELVPEQVQSYVDENGEVWVLNGEFYCYIGNASKPKKWDFEKDTVSNDIIFRGCYIRKALLENIEQ